MAGFLNNTQSPVAVADSYQDLCEEVTQAILALSIRNIATNKTFTMVLSGGATPRGIYECMSRPSYREKFQWEQMHFFWGDERWVPSEDRRSNYRMASEALFSKVKIPSGNIHPIPTNDSTLQASVRMYEETISDFFHLKKGEFPRFDLVLLGLGVDGHVASLFPDNHALAVNDRLAIPVSQKGTPESRITLTLPTINHADNIFFVVSGFEKAEIVHEVLEEKGSILPANEILPLYGKAYWFLDVASASGLQPGGGVR